MKELHISTRFRIQSRCQPGCQPIDAADGGGFMVTLPDIAGVMADGATKLESLADGREAFIATVSAR